MIVDNAVYVDGKRTPSVSLQDTFETLRGRGGFAWIALYRPDLDEFAAVATEFNLPELAVHDALAGHQRAKIERYGSCAFVVLRPAGYIDETEKVEFGELHVFLGTNFIITIRHFDLMDLRVVRRRLESEPDVLARGPLMVFYSILDQMVDDYTPVLEGLQNDIDEIEDQLFNGDRGVSRRIYELSTEVMLFQRAANPVKDVLATLRTGLAHDDEDGDTSFSNSFRQVQDHLLRVTERSDGFREILQNALMVHTTLVAQSQNDEVKKISGWAAVLFTPTLVGTVYGMNFTNMPELHWAYGYPYALALMAGMGVGLYVLFKRKGWL